MTNLDLEKLEELANRPKTGAIVSEYGVEVAETILAKQDSLGNIHLVGITKFHKLYDRKAKISKDGSIRVIGPWRFLGIPAHNDVGQGIQNLIYKEGYSDVTKRKAA